MVQSLKILNSKETKQIYELLEAQYGYTGKLDAVFMLSEKKQRIYLFTRDLAKMDISRLRVDSMGLYFGTLFEGKLRLIAALVAAGERRIEVRAPHISPWCRATEGSS
jgi:hypothetical protein